MATRINNAKNFNGKSYVVTDEITNILNSLKYENGKLMFQGANVQDEQNIGQTASASEVDISGLISFITSGKESNKIVTTDNTGNFAYTNAITTSIDTNVSSASDDKLPTEKAVRAAIDAVQQEAISVNAGDGISVTSNGTAKTVATDIKLVALDTATAGYAASYQLQIKDAVSGGYKSVGDTLNIPKDQFLEDAVFIASATAEDVTNAGSGTTIVEGKPCIKFTFAIHTKDETTGAETETSKLVYIDTQDLVDTYSAGNGGIAINGYMVSAVVDNTDTVYAAKGSATAVLSITSDGIKVSGVQNAIDLAATNVYDKTATAISAVNTQVETFESSVNTAIAATTSAVNTKVDGAVTNVNTNVSAAITAVNGKVDTAIGNVNTALTSTVTAVNTNVSAAITAVDGKVNTAITNVNSAINTTVTAVNTNVGTAISAVDANVSAVVTNVNTAISSTIADVNTQVSAVASQVVQIVDTAISTEGKVTSNASGQTVTITGVTGKVLAVYGVDGAQMYPEIKKVGDTYTLTAVYGPSDTVDSAWSVLHTQEVTYSAATVTPVTAVTGSGYTPATVTSADSVASAGYTNANVTSASDVNAVTYTNASAGNAATAGTAAYDNGTTVGGLDYKNA